MKKNVIVIALIFVLPMLAYFLLSTPEASAKKQASESNKPQVLKFSSLMCRDCQSLRKTLEKVFPDYENDISLIEIDVQKNNNFSKSMIEKYNITLVPTTIFISRDGKKIKRVEGDIKKEQLEKYLKGLINE